jgi:hypothetical protein
MVRCSITDHRMDNASDSVQLSCGCDDPAMPVGHADAWIRQWIRYDPVTEPVTFASGGDTPGAGDARPLDRRHLRILPVGRGACDASPVCCERGSKALPGQGKILS